jgi:hypothetical protein
MDMLLSIINFFLNWYIWLPIVIFLIFLSWKNFTKANQTYTNPEGELLVLEIPKANDKSELAAEQLFASLHGIFRDKEELRLNDGVQEHLSFEIASINSQIRFFVWVPKALRSFVEGQIYSQYPTVQISKADEDYVVHETTHEVSYSADIDLSDSEMLPIKTFTNFEVDPLAGITGALAKLDNGEEVWVQILMKPIADSWHKDSEFWVNSVKNSKNSFFGSIDIAWFGKFIEALWRPPEYDKNSNLPKELSDRNKTRIAEAEKKATKLGYKVKIRIVYLGDNTVNARLRMQAIVGTFKQFNSTNLNGFKIANASFRKEDLVGYKDRTFDDGGYILNIEELASVFHLPHTNVETPNVVWASTKTAEPPAKLPIITGNSAIDENISAFGMTNFRGINHQFGMYRFDRSRHVYIIGQTGAGKTGALALLALSDIFHGHGYAIIDPHGDFAVDNMRFIPGSRLQDVIYFNPADTAYPIGFNPLEVMNPNQKTNISSEVIGVLKRMFGESWGPRLEYILRYTILALLDRPSTTMLDITRMLTNKAFRKETLEYCKDTVVLNFWKMEFATWNEKFVAEAISPVLNKVGAFTANPIIRNIIGQPKSTFDIRKIMDEGKILIVNLSKGLIGEDNAAILGSFIVTKIQLAAMSRSNIESINDRRPFYLYVDEFQNFATDSFATILSEARKYGLNLTVANQYISQMTENVRDAVFGNVGTMLCFRVSADDAPILAKQFEPQFEAQDLLQMHNRNFVINMVINGEKAPAFNATTLTLPQPQTDNLGAIIGNTRNNYSRTREEIEKEISAAITPPENLNPTNKGEQPSLSDRNQNKPKAPNTIKWPAGIKPINFAAKANDDKKPEYPTPEKTEGNNKPKRRRQRKRKPNPDNQNQSNYQTKTAPQQHRDRAEESNKPSNEPPAIKPAKVYPKDTLVIKHDK